MRGGSTLYVLALGLLSPGCAVIETGVRVAWREVAEAVEDCREHWRNRRWAVAAWEKVSSACPAQGHSADYAKGFKDGFTAFLDRGGDGVPPLVAPAHYRRFGYQTPQGYQAIEDWFAGYRHGVGVARQTDYRRLITGPVGPPPAPPPGPAPAVDHGPSVVGPAPEETLPAPRIFAPNPTDRQGQPPAEEPPPAPRLGAAQALPPTADARTSPEEPSPTGQGQPPAEEPPPAAGLGGPLASPPEPDLGKSPDEPPRAGQG
jgi:hypothetical protein